MKDPTALQQAIEDAELQADLAKIDLTIAKVRAEVGDDRLNMFDVANIIHASEHFCVTRRQAYYRAQQLCLLSWQEEPADV
jgi:hypothetical protein